MSVKDPSLTLGIEEEYQIVDPETGELRSYITQVLDSDGQITIEGIKPELHQSVVEVGSRVCSTPTEIRDEVVRLRRAVIELAAKDGLAVLAAGTHPFSSWMEQEITPLERYLGVEQDLQDLARKNLIFGMHVHVGIEDRDFLIDAMKVSRYFLPHILALSTSSPFWMGRSTGLRSYRSVQWRNFPRTGIPPTFSSYAEYEHIVRSLVNANAIPDASKIWWDLRPHHLYPTLEFRLCDICTRIDEAVCIAAIIQALVAKLWKLRHDNMTFRVYPLSLIEENKWRAVRYGVAGNLLDLGKETERPARELLEELIGWFLDDVLDDLGSRAEVEYAHTIFERGTSADRQLAVFEETGDLKAVVDHLVAETREGTGY
ncbi:MAG: carboxylate-amine ligase [Gemmatimonadota bacterium]|nr:carboxylate-amine ligase [Gemmatimonadota bacterium]MDE3005357.1 carboxylate-amine ligase [Gemmatimonadota bacterium]MDE3014684.1 carboxylate-amine ligase [Gemmatimonadota bacterium]